MFLQTLQEKLARGEDDRKHNEAMRSQLSRVNQLEQENRRLRDEVVYYKYIRGLPEKREDCANMTFFRETLENNLELKEELKSLRAKAERVEELTSRVEQLQLRNEVKRCFCVPRHHFVLSDALLVSLGAGDSREAKHRSFELVSRHQCINSSVRTAPHVGLLFRDSKQLAELQNTNSLLRDENLKLHTK